MRDACPLAAAAQTAGRLTDPPTDGCVCRLCHSVPLGVSQTVKATFDEPDQVKSRRDHDSGACDSSCNRILHAPVHGHPLWKVTVCLMTVRIDVRPKGSAAAPSRRS